LNEAERLLTQLFIFNGVRELPAVGCTLWQSFGLSVGFPMNRDKLWGFANVCNVGGVSSSFFAGGRKKQNKFPSNLHCPVKKLNPLLFFKLLLSYLSARLSFLHLLPTVCSYPKGGTFTTNVHSEN